MRATFTGDVCVMREVIKTPVSKSLQSVFPVIYRELKYAVIKMAGEFQ